MTNLGTFNIDDLSKAIDTLWTGIAQHYGLDDEDEVKFIMATRRNINHVLNIRRNDKGGVSFGVTEEFCQALKHLSEDELLASIPPVKERMS